MQALQYGPGGDPAFIVLCELNGCNRREGGKPLQTIPTISSL